MVMQNSNVNVTKDSMGRDAKTSVLWTARIMEPVQLKSIVLPVSNNGNAFVLITSQVKIICFNINFY